MISGRKLVSLFLITVLLIGYFQILAPTATVKITAASNLATVNFRFVVNGKVNKVTGYQSDGEYYTKSQDIKDALDDSPKPFNTSVLNSKTVPIASVVVNKTKYYSMQDIAKAMDFSCTNDTILGAIYIWTDLNYDESAALAKGEIRKAEKLGFVPKALQKNLNRSVSFKEYCQMLRTVINSYDSELLDKWDTVAKTAARSDAKMTRGDGMLALLEAAVVMGQNSFNTEWGELHKKIGEKCWDELSNRNFKLFSNIYNTNALTDYPDCNFEAASYFYSFGRKSMITGNTLYDYNTKANSMQPDKILTREDAIKSVIRFYDSINTSKMLSIAKMSDNKIAKYDTSIITANLLSKANSLDAVTAGNTPYWTGFTYGFAYKDDLIKRFNESDIRNMANWGFNSVRVYINYQDIFNEDMTEVDLHALKALDRLISYAMKYNMHMNLCFPSLPGWWTEMNSDYSYKGSLDLFTNDKHLKQAETLWKILAKRYKNIPNSSLSFDPIFEPENKTRSTGSDIIKNTNYTVDDVARDVVGLINAIKSESPERLITFGSVSLTDLNENPVEAAAKQAGALIMSNYAANPYIYWNWNMYQTDDRVFSGFLPRWPLTTYNVQTEIKGENYLDETARNTPLVFNGELVKGTVYDIYITKVSGSGTIIVTAGDKEIYREDINPRVGKDGCISKEDDTYLYKTGDPFSFVYPHAKSEKTISFTLNKDEKDLKVAFIGSNSKAIRWSEIDVTLPNNYAVERWWNESYYDAYNNGTTPGMSKRRTSQIIIDPIGDLKCSTITITSDVTYSTEDIAEKVDKSYIANWLEARLKANNAPALTRFESAFSGKVGDTITDYYDDMLAIFKDRRLSWFNNDFATITAGEGGSYAGDKLVHYGDYRALDTRILKLLQKYQ